VDWHEDVLALPSWDPPFRVPDVVFCGNYYGSTFPGTGERASAIRSLWDAGIAVGVVGVGWPSDFPVVGRCGVKQQAHIYRKAKVALSINNFNSIELYYSDRQLIAMASGTPVVCKYVPGLEREFDNGSDCLWFRETPELIAHVKTLLENPEGRRRLGAAGRARIQRSHTWWHRILEVLPIVEHLRADS
jgi:spore maturation protein CgeB